MTGCRLAILRLGITHIMSLSPEINLNVSKKKYQMFQNVKDGILRIVYRTHI